MIKPTVTESSQDTRLEKVFDSKRCSRRYVLPSDEETSREIFLHALKTHFRTLEVKAGGLTLNKALNTNFTIENIVDDIGNIEKVLQFKTEWNE